MFSTFEFLYFFVVENLLVYIKLLIFKQVLFSLILDLINDIVDRLILLLWISSWVQ